MWWRARARSSRSVLPLTRSRPRRPPPHTSAALRLGTLDAPDAEAEWVLRPYMNTAKKRRAL